MTDTKQCKRRTEDGEFSLHAYVVYRAVVSVCRRVFSARQHICYSALYAIARPSVRPSVCLSVCPSVTRVDQSKTVEVRITQPSPQSSPMTLVS